MKNLILFTLLIKNILCQTIPNELVVGNSYNLSWNINNFHSKVNLTLLYSLQNSFPATFSNGSYIIHQEVNNTGNYNWNLNTYFNYINIEDYTYKFQINDNYTTEQIKQNIF